MEATSNISELFSLASSQWGLFTAAQALEEGVSRTQLTRMASDGRIEPVSYGTYTLAIGEETAHCALKAAWLSLSPKVSAHKRLASKPYDAVVTGRTAAYLHGETALYEAPYTFAVEKGRRTSREDIRLHPWRIDETDLVIIEGLPVASVERTIADMVKANDDPSLIGGFIEGAARRGTIVDRAKLARLLSPLAARNGYPKNDGDMFASELIKDYAEAPQIGYAIDALMAALASSPTYQELVQRLPNDGENANRSEPHIKMTDIGNPLFTQPLNRLCIALDPYRKLTGDVQYSAVAIPQTPDGTEGESSERV